MERLQQITKTRGADKYENIPKNSVGMMHKSIKKRSWNSTKKMLKNKCQQIKKYSKNDPKSVPKDEGISGVAPLGAPLVALTAFGHQMLPPRAPKVPPMIEKSTKNDLKEPPDCEKELPNSSLLGTWPGGLREALTICMINAIGCWTGAHNFLRQGAVTLAWCRQHFAHCA